MSFISTLKSTAINDQRCLVDTLKGMKYNPRVAPNQTIRGDTRADSRKGFDIVLKREDTGYRGDIGFKRDTDGFFTTVMDSFIINEFTPAEFQKKVADNYLINKGKSTAKKLGLVYVSHENVTVKGRKIVRYNYQKVGA